MKLQSTPIDCICLGRLSAYITIVLLLTGCSSARPSDLFAQDAPQSKHSNPFGRPTALQKRQIEDVLHRFQYERIEVVGGSHQRAAQEVGTKIVPYLTDALDIRRDRIYYDPLIGKNFDANESVIGKAAFALGSFARRDEAVLTYLASRLGDENAFRCVKLIEIIEAVALDVLPESGGLPTIKSALESATQDGRARVVHASKQALKNIEIAERRFKRQPDTASIVFPVTKLSETHPAIQLLESATQAASHITKIYFRDNAYAKIADALLEQGEIAAAIVITERIAEEHARREARIRIAVHSAAAGDVVRTIELSDGHHQQVEVLTSLAIILSRTGRSDELRTILTKVEYDHQRNDIHAAIAKDQLTRGDVAAALKTIEHMNYEHSRIKTLFSLIPLAKSVGNQPASETIAKTLFVEAKRETHLSSRALRFIEIAEAARLAQLTTLSDRAFNDALAALPNSELSKEDLAFYEIKVAYEATSRKQYEIAKKLAMRIERGLSDSDNTALRSGDRAAVALIRIMSGQMIEAERREILSLPPGALDHEHLVTLARLDVARGNLDAAFEVVERMHQTATHGSEYQRAKAVVEIVSELLRVGDYDGAVRASTKWPSRDPPGMGSIISHMINAGKFDLAADLASRFKGHTQDTVKALKNAGALRAALRLAVAVQSNPRVVNVRIIGGKVIPTEWGDARGDVQAQIAIEALKRDQTEILEKALEQVHYPLTRGLLLCDLADTEREGGNPRADRTWIDEAKELVAGTTLESSRTRLQCRIVKSLVAAGRLNEAAAFDRSARSEDVTQAHALALAGAGGYERALELVEGIESPSIRANGMTELATKLAGLTEY